MLDADGPQDLMNQASDLANVAASNNRALARVEAARIVATVLDEQAATALAAQTAAGGAGTAREGGGRGQGRRPDRPDRRAPKKLTRQLSRRLANARGQGG